MKQLLFILALLIGTCFATHAKTIKLVPSALDSTRMDTVVISDLQDVTEDQNAAMHDISYVSYTHLDVYTRQHYKYAVLQNDPECHLHGVKSQSDFFREQSPPIR